MSISYGDVIDDLLDARDDLEELLDEALPALAARPTAEGAEILAVLLVAPGRRGGPDERLRRLVVRRVERRASPEAAAVLAAIAALGDPDIATRAAAALERLAADGVVPAIEGIGATELGEGRRVGENGLAARVRRRTEPGDRLLKLWLEPAADGILAGGWTDPLDPRRFDKERERFVRMAQSEGADPSTPLEPAETVAAIDGLVRRTADLGLPISEGVALILPQLRRAAGAPDWPAFDVVAMPDEGPRPPARRRRGRA